MTTRTGWVVTVAAAIVFSAVPAMAAFDAINADKVDGKHAVAAGASSSSRRGKLVATDGKTGRLPNNIIAKAPDADKLDGISSNGFVRDGDAAGGALAGSYPAPTLKAPEAWIPVQQAVPNDSTIGETCVPGHFCYFFGFGPGGPVSAYWTNYGAGYTTTAFYKDPFGVVHLKGLVKHGGEPFAPNHIVFQLPEGYRPTTTHIFATVGSTGDGWVVAPGRVDVAPSGFVTIVIDCNDTTPSVCSANGRSYMSLDGISFRLGS